MRSCGRVRDLFLRLLGVIFAIAFLSLLVQVDVLLGREGLLPAGDYLRALAAGGGARLAPTVFWIASDDVALRAVAVLGILAGVALTANVAPRVALVVAWALYLSFVNVGQDFLSFQWDNLLLETAVFALFLTPGGVWPRRAPAPHPIAIFLMRWLVFRLNAESGAAKLLTGDPTWRNLTAMSSYYETAPLPTWIGWYAHQMPLWAHRGVAGFTLVAELALAPLVFAPHRVRGVVVAVMALFQVAVLLTANYGFFNCLSLALLLLVLDDDHLRWIAACCRVRLAPAAPCVAGPWRVRMLAAVALVAVPLSIVPFLPFLDRTAARAPVLAPVFDVLEATRSLNAYHLFAQMTLVRREVVLEGSDDGVTWRSYELRYKPGDPQRPPPFVAPHQPRLDFQLWFLPLGGQLRARYFDTLLTRLLARPAVVAPLFARDPFPITPPRLLRVLLYRYRFSDAATRRASGAWWTRELLWTSRTLTAPPMDGGS
jgi:lipase maturation factor 1